MSAPTASTAAPTQIAAVMPLVYASGDAYEPLCENTVARTAMPSTPPSSRIALVAPEAWPASSGRTAPSTALAAGAKTIAMPAPAITNGITSWLYGTSGVGDRRQPADPAGLQRQADGHQRPRADPVRQQRPRSGR